MIDYTYFELQNPWWGNRHAIDEDEKIKEFDHLKFQYQPKHILSLATRPGDINLITGPRQTGKSMAIKLYIRRLLAKGVAANSILYFNCDALSTEKDIIDLIIEFSRLNDNKQAVIFLDEITSVSNWPQGIKWLADTGLLKKSTLFLTGSSSINLKKSGEFLPGRRGSGKDVIYLPLSYFEYLQLIDNNLRQVQFGSSQSLTTLKKLDGIAKKYFDNFLLTGGFLRNINYGVSEITNDLYLKTLKSELFKEGKKEDSLREVILKIINSISSQTSYTNIAEEAELGSKNTAIDYLNFLSDSFFLKELKFYDINRRRVILKKNKKFYALDPYLLWLFFGFVNGSQNFSGFFNLYDRSKMIENFIASELCKSHQEIFFYQNSRELDFYLPRKLLGIEVKYKGKITSDDLEPLLPVSKKILLSKNTLEKRGDTFIIPAYLFPLVKI